MNGGEIIMNDTETKRLADLTADTDRTPQEESERVSLQAKADSAKV